MKILGIDYGRSKLGLAVAESILAEPYKVIRVSSMSEAVEKSAKEAEALGISKVVVGISEGEMGKESASFKESLSQQLTIPVEIFDETLTTQDAQKLAREAGIKRAKRRALEDAYAAALMLQNYIDLSTP